MLSSPIDLPTWLEENGQLLRPPVNNCCVYRDGVTVMVVGGPNSRTDYHVNPTPEWFYQYRGAMTLRVVDDGRFRDIVIRQGAMFLLPAGVPHSPVRFADTVGIVVEQPRPPSAPDRMRWYCRRCCPDAAAGGGGDGDGLVADAAVVVHEAVFHCTDLGSQVKQAVEEFAASREQRTCPVCGLLADPVPPPGSIADPNLDPGR